MYSGSISATMDVVCIGGDPAYEKKGGKMRYRQKIRIRLWIAVLLLLAGLTGCGKKAAVYDSTAKESAAETEQTEVVSEEEKASPILVYICGEVCAPGVYELPKDSRIIDAVEAAGGMTEEAAGTYLNLAETLSDGQKIEVPSAETAESLTEAAAMDAAGLVNLNRASETELMTLTGIGASKAKEIISYRESKGGFQKTEDLMNIPGIKEGVFNKIKDRITV